MKRLDHYWYSQNIIVWLLLPLSGLFCFIATLRRFLYRINLFKSYESPVPVIVVGNITVGGTGKTPLIIEFCQQLKKRGLKPGIISRGYGGQSGHYPLLVGADISALDAGDEPVLIARRTNCPVVVGADREADIKLLLAEQKCDVIFSDDGLQHYRLNRQAEIAVIDQTRKFGNGFCIPSGPLREPVGRLKTVDMTIANGGGSDISSFAVAINKLMALDDSAEASLEIFKDKKIHALAGIGNPDRFFKILEDNAIDYIPHVFPDHHIYKEDDIMFNDELAVLMTEKDAVKCKVFNLNNYWYMPIDVQLSETAQQRFDQIIQQVCHG
jgi:tetraacyldisaccharide 4'-kinase